MRITSEFVQKTLNKYLPIAGDAIVPCAYEHFDDNAQYDADAGVITDDPTSEHQVGIVFADFSFTKTQSGWKEIEGSSIQAKDKKGIMLTTELPTGVVPRKDDIVVAEDGTKFFVVGQNVDPYQGAYLLHLRPEEEV